MRWGKRRKRALELAPDEIFLDSYNIPDFDQGRLEGRLEKPLPERVYLGLLGAVALIFVALVTQAANLGIIQGEKYAAQSERNRLRPEVLFAERGAIVDRNGVPLVENEPGADGYPDRNYRAPGFSLLLGYVSYPKKDKSGFYYDTEIKGLAGAELQFEERLKGQNGTLLVEENALGQIQSQGSVRQPVPGETVSLAIDYRAQEALYDAVKEVADMIPYQGGAAVLMDVTTGEVHALVSYPEYDSNVLSKGQPADLIEGYLSDFRQPYLNRPVAGLYTPGSIVKPVVAAGAHHDGVIAAATAIVSTGSISIPNPYNPSNPTIFRDWKAHGATDMRQSIAVSSDVYFYTIGGGFNGQKGLGIERLAFWYRAFGYTDPTGIDLSGEKSGFVPTPAWKEETYDEPWRIGNTFHTAIGQYAMQVTPLEAVRATAAIANGGKLVVPTIEKGKPIQGHSIAINPEALRVVREGMRLSVTEGTALGLNDLSYMKAAGKTGTAQLGANNEWYNTWLVGFFPYDNPKYAFAVVMERAPAGTAIGGVYVAHKAFSKLRQTAPEYFGLSAD
ncbi:MAG TPA: penicillin-binding transpeptidase domain-containing protein [Candidatus Paceibacterota bacterium]|nr:penicillin-binding transpeptidase domain-containing protein [Candidatus Paceibacterota bacterium]